MNRPSLSGRVAELLTDRGLVRSGETVLVAVSGGGDSVVLLHLLTRLAPRLGLSLHAAHLNHGLRGRAADRDQRFTERLCEQWHVPLTAEVRPVAAHKGESPQAAARRVRYAFLREVAARTGAAAILTAHHADDLAETVLMRLINGAGTGGLAAIPQISGIPGGGADGPPVARPLLYAPKAELTAYRTRHNLAHVEDASNRDPRYTRSRIRHELMPLLAGLNPAIVETLTRQARALADEEAYLAAQAEAAWEGVAAARDGRILLNREALAALPPALARRVVYRALCAFVPEQAQAVHVAAVLDLSKGETGKQLDLPGGITARCSYDTIAIGPAHTGARPTEIPLQLPGITPVPWANLSIEACYRPFSQEGWQEGCQEGREAGWVWFDPATFSVPLTVRARRPGDRFRPAGMEGHTRKLKNYFIDRKIPREVRDRTPLVAAPEGLLWVAGERQDERFMVKDRAACDSLLALRLHAHGTGTNRAGTVTAAAS